MVTPERARSHSVFAADAWRKLKYTTLAELGERDEACEAFREALEIDPSDGRARLQPRGHLGRIGFCGEAGEHRRAYLNSTRRAHGRSAEGPVGKLGALPGDISDDRQSKDPARSIEQTETAASDSRRRPFPL